MSKEQKEQVKVKWYQKAIVPWMIIAFMATAVGFCITGWFLAKADNNRVGAEASAMIKPVVEQLSKTSK